MGVIVREGYVRSRVGQQWGTDTFGGLAVLKAPQVIVLTIIPRTKVAIIILDWLDIIPNPNFLFISELLGILMYDCITIAFRFDLTRLFICYWIRWIIVFFLINSLFYLYVWLLSLLFYLI